MGLYYILVNYQLFLCFLQIWYFQTSQQCMISIIRLQDGLNIIVSDMFLLLIPSQKFFVPYTYLPIQLLKGLFNPVDRVASGGGFLFSFKLNFVTLKWFISGSSNIQVKDEKTGTVHLVGSHYISSDSPLKSQWSIIFLLVTMLLHTLFYCNATTIRDL